MPAWNHICICDNHSNDNHDLSYGKPRLFAPLPADSTRGTGRLWLVRANRNGSAEYR